ncbi:MAG: chromate efflux transporter [Alphaproteobacteria bacterium]|nr:chromate efflux transporter [Alphaproteobacteria bacterium]
MSADMNRAEGPPGLPTFAEAFRVWLKIGFLSFGGPAGQIALMHRILVEEKRWIGEARFLHALNYCMLLPGPEAQQLATYVGWLLHRTAGGLAAGLLFVLPGFFVILALSTAYAVFEGTTALQTVFFGLKAAVLAIVVEAVLRVGKRALKNRLMIAVAAAAFVGIFALGVPFPIIVLAAGLLGLAGGRLRPDLFAVGGGHQGKGVVVEGLIDRLPPHTLPSLAHALRTAALWATIWAAPIFAVLLLQGGDGTLAAIGWFFSKMAVVTFGGAYAVLSYVAQEAVGSLGWLRPGEMLDGLAMAETTPGPLILVLSFVGFLASMRAPAGLDPLLAGLIGATLTTWVTFAPCFLWIFAGAPWVESIRQNKLLAAALSTITAAVVGVILNLAVWFALHVLFREVGALEAGPLSLAWPRWATIDWGAAVLSLGAMVAMLRFRVGMIWTLAASAAAGAVIRLVL